MKKASIYSDTVIWFWRIILITVISVFIYLITSNYLNPDISTGELELNVLKTKLLYSDSCLKYKNPGEIDITKVNDITLEKCYLKKNIGYRINLTDINNNQVKTASRLTDYQELQIELCNDNCFSTSEYVLYNENNNLNPGILIIEMVKDE